MANMSKVSGGTATCSRQSVPKKAVISIINPAGIEHTFETQNIVQDRAAAKANLKVLECALKANGFKVKSCKIVDALESVTGGKGQASTSRTLQPKKRKVPFEPVQRDDKMNCENPKHKQRQG